MLSHALQEAVDLGQHSHLSLLVIPFLLFFFILASLDQLPPVADLKILYHKLFEIKIKNPSGRSR